MGWSGILIRGTGNVALNNYSHNNNIDGIEVWGSHVQVLGNRTASNGLGTSGGSGIEVTVQAPDSGFMDIYIQGNISYLDNGGFTSQIASGLTISDLTLLGNSFLFSQTRGIQIGLASGGTWKNVIVKGNLIDTTAGASALGIGINVGGGVSLFSVDGNIVTNTNNGNPNAINIESTAAQGSVIGNIVDTCWVGIASGGSGSGLLFSLNHVTNAAGAAYVLTNGTSLNNY
jgi:hypothetical protein